jgi:hypothetical protein
MRKDSAEYDEFSTFFFDRTRYEHSNDENARCESCDYLIDFESNENFVSKICDSRIDWRETGIETTITGEDSAHFIENRSERNSRIFGREWWIKIRRWQEFFSE